MESKKELLEIVRNSRLGASLKDIWEIFLEVCTKEQIDAILELLKEDAQQIYFLTENIQDKFWAMKSWNKRYLSGIITRERDYLLQ